MIKQFRYKKITFSLLFLSTFLEADFLLYLEESKNKKVSTYCISNYYYFNDRLYFLQSNDKSYNNIILSHYSKFSIDSGYLYDLDNDICIISDLTSSDFSLTENLPLVYKNFSFLGLSLEHFNALMALSGLLISAIFLFGLIKLI